MRPPKPIVMFPRDFARAFLGFRLLMTLTKHEMLRQLSSFTCERFHERTHHLCGNFTCIIRTTSHYFLLTETAKRLAMYFLCCTADLQFFLSSYLSRLHTDSTKLPKEQ